VLFVHASPRLETDGCGLRTERQWLQLGALAQMFEMQGLFDYAAEGLSGAVERECRKRKRSTAVWEVVGRLRKMIERDPWMGLRMSYVVFEELGSEDRVSKRMERILGW